MALGPGRSAGAGRDRRCGEGARGYRTGAARAAGCRGPGRPGAAPRWTECSRGLQHRRSALRFAAGAGRRARHPRLLRAELEDAVACRGAGATRRRSPRPGGAAVSQPRRIRRGHGGPFEPWLRRPVHQHVVGRTPARPRAHLGGRDGDRLRRGVRRSGRRVSGRGPASNRRLAFHAEPPLRRSLRPLRRSSTSSSPTGRSGDCDWPHGPPPATSCSPPAPPEHPGGRRGECRGSSTR